MEKLYNKSEGLISQIFTKLQLTNRFEVYMNWKFQHEIVLFVNLLHFVKEYI